MYEEMHGTMHGPAVTRSTLRQQIADALRDEVLAGRLQPGQEFTVKEIAELYGVSATPVREAMVDLSAQGLLDSVQHRGFRVHEYSVGDYRRMIEARALVAEGIYRALVARADAAGGSAPGGSAAGAGAAGAAAGTAGTVGSGEGADSGGDAASAAAGFSGLGPLPAGALLGVRRRGEEAQRAAYAGDLTVLIGYDLRFWRELTAHFGNPYLADFLYRLHVQSWVCAVPLLRRQRDLRGQLWAGHTELVDALLRRDPHGALAVVVAYDEHSLALIERLAPR